MKTFFKEILDYTYIFNNRVIEELLSNPNHPDKSVKLINHTINSQEIWNSRVQNKEITIDVWGLRLLENLKDINQKNYEDSVAILDRFDFEQQVTYTNTKGQTFINTVQDIFFHMVNHSTYHRAQIATDFKANGLTPLVTDYIFHKRSQLNP